MCGRFALASEKHILEMLFEIDLKIDFEPRFNIAPSQEVPTVRRNPENGKIEFALLKWGLVPFWADDQSIGAKMINARSETVTEKPSFRDPFKKRRLIVPASGFYEWKKEGSGKQPYYIYRRDGSPMLIAGLWDRWGKQGMVLETFTILTTESNEYLRPIHNRMPLILKRSDYPDWLDGQAQKEDLVRMLKPYPPEELKAYPVSKQINTPGNDFPALIKEEKG